MRIGVPAEIKNNEFRVAMTPAGVMELRARGHEVVVQAGAGEGSRIADADYVAAGAQIVSQAADVWSAAEMVVKVKEPIACEYQYFRDDLTLFTYLHLAADEPLTRALVESGVTAIAYETVEGADGSLPLLAPMSEVAGRLAPQVGAATLMRAQGGRGVLMGGVPGVRPANVVVIGGGVAGSNAAMVAVGMGAQVSVLDTNVHRLHELDALYTGRLTTVTSNRFEVERACVEADMVIGAVLVPGARAPRLVTDALVAQMKPGSVLVDIAIDQGGCFESSRPTTHADPTFTVGESVMYCVANMPGAVPHTSTFALTNVTMPYVVKIADRGCSQALADDAGLRAGLNVSDSVIVNAGVAAAFGHLPSRSAVPPVGY